VGRLHFNPLLGFRVHPAAEDAAAWKRKSVHTVVSNDGQFEVAVEWRGGYWLPLHPGIIRHLALRFFDPNQFVTKCLNAASHRRG
jgi:hypothetical protein